MGQLTGLCLILAEMETVSPRSQLIGVAASLESDNTLGHRQETAISDIGPQSPNVTQINAPNARGKSETAIWGLIHSPMVVQDALTPWITLR